ncbi:MAG TPA: MFS transporter [Actinospica sp.]|jgi:MFS family permease|nr:MFS transporter [Actinospica sp.]
MTTAPVGQSEPTELDTGRLHDATRLRVVLIVLAIVASTEIVPFQTAFIGLAAQKIGASFPAAGSQLPWLATIYTLVGGVAVPVIGKLSDVIGKKKVIAACVAVSLVGSVLDAVTTSWTVLLVGRALQGVAFPAMFVSFGLIRDLVPRRMVNMAIGIAGGGTGLGAILGPLAGGYLTDHFSWRSLFWFCTVWIVASLILLMVFVPETRLRHRVRLDLPGAALLGAGIALVMIYVSRGSGWGWGRPVTLAWLIGGVLLLGAFYLWELRVPEPIMSPALLRSGRFLPILGIGFCCNGIVNGASYVIGYLAETPGGAAGEAVKSQIATGAAAAAAKQYHLPTATLKPYFSVIGDLPGFNLTLFQFTVQLTLGLAVVYVIFSPLAGALSTRIGLQRPLIAGMAFFVLSCLLLTFYHRSVLEVALILVLLGVGVGIYLSTLNNMVVEAVPQEQQGVSSGMVGSVTNFGAAFATSIIASVVAAHPLILHVNAPGHVTNTPLNTGALAQLPTAGAYTQMFLIFTIAAAAALVLSLFMRHFRHPATGGTRY